MTRVEDLNVSVEQFLGENVPPQAFSVPLPDALAAEVTERLKQEADRYWAIDPHRSLEFADRIVAIGRAQGDDRRVALGLMARGDALKFLGRMEEAWNALEQAGNLFQLAGDEVGWARTRIGRLYLGAHVNRVEDTLADAEQARAIFTRHGEHEKLLRLHLNGALLYTWLSDLRQALRLYDSALVIAETLGETGRQYLGPLNTNIGLTYLRLGDFRQAMAHYERARALMAAANETKNIAILEIDIAWIARAQGHYRRALDLLHDVLARIADQLPWDAATAKCGIVECYLHLNRYAEARDLARQAITDYRVFNTDYRLAWTLLLLANAEAELANFTAARAALDEAEPIFTSLGAASWVAKTHLRRGRIALKQGDAAAAYREATAAAAQFNSDEQQVDYATSVLLQGQALAALGNIKAAAEAGAGTLRTAQRQGIPSLRYAAHVLLGQIAETQHQATHAMRHYRAAAATVERVQRGLTITLRPGFLEDQAAALRALIGLHLRLGQAEQAFTTLEQAKSQVLLGYLANREHLRWTRDDPRSRALIEELNHLRDEHQWFYSLAHDPPRSDDDRFTPIQKQGALAEVTSRERRMRAITEQLYLRNSADHTANYIYTASAPDVQSYLDEDTLLAEFYNDGDQLWAFTLDAHTLAVHHLPIENETLNELLAQLQTNLAAALKLDANTTAGRNLTRLAQRILWRLYSVLIKPLALHLHDRRRLVVVPYGVLHYLPFHLLYDGSQYLIQQYEVVVMPAAGLASQPGPQRRPGALILAHSWKERLPNTQAEAQIVQSLFGGELRAELAATRTALQAPPGQILHIAAHGQYRLDQPDLSYLQLADGQLYADDLLQQDLSYELVTLSACETGRANAAGGDELIGLGRGFLYAGAGALILSLWQVLDTTATVRFMEHLYRALKAGTSKASALRTAQRALLADDAQLHPALWGAFQLVGNPQPLSSAVD